MSIQFGRMLGLVRRVLGVLETIVNPILMLAIRLWLAAIFFKHGLGTAYGMAVPSEFLASIYLLEIAAAAFVALGVATRIAAIPIAGLSFFVYFGQLGSADHLYYGILAGILIVEGAGRFSIDRLFRRGTALSALPFAAPFTAALKGFEWAAKPCLLLALRVWMGGLFWFAGEMLVNSSGMAWIDYQGAVASAALSPLMANPVSMFLQLLAGAALALGLAGRLSAAILMIVTGIAYFGGHGAPEHLTYLVILGHILFAGPGPLALDKPVHEWLRRQVPQYDGKPAFSLEGCPRVVIVGAGFGGLAAAKALAQTKAQVTVIDRHNYHLFQPLLYQVATAGLSPSDIAMPIRGILRGQFNTSVLFGKVTGVDKQSKYVLIGDQRIPYDYLILATGARHAYFGKDDWEGVAPGLKKIDDATHVRQRVLLAFERAEAASDPAERLRMLTFAIVGAGPTGVELAGAIAELARQGMQRDFRNIDPASARVILVQSADRVLPVFSPELSQAAMESLTDIGVEVRLGGRVTEIDQHGIAIGDERIPAGTVLWAAGVQASRAAKWLGCEADRAGRVVVDERLTLPGHPDIFVIGDTAAVQNADGSPVPGLAPAAKQAGDYVARLIAARITGAAEPGRFHYRHQGSLATIGRNSAIADFGFLKLKGHLAWWLWGVVHVVFLLGARNRIAVMINWIWSYFSYRSSTRLITGSVEEPEENALP